MVAAALALVWELVTQHIDGDIETAAKKQGNRQTWAKARAGP